MCGIVIEVFVVVRTNNPFDDTGSELNAELRRDDGFCLFVFETEAEETSDVRERERERRVCVCVFASFTA